MGMLLSSCWMLVSIHLVASLLGSVEYSFFEAVWCLRLKGPVAGNKTLEK